jgi:hypothetical protein
MQRHGVPVKVQCLLGGGTAGGGVCTGMSLSLCMSWCILMRVQRLHHHAVPSLHWQRVTSMQKMVAWQAGQRDPCAALAHTQQGGGTRLQRDGAAWLHGIRTTGGPARRGSASRCLRWRSAVGRILGGDSAKKSVVNVVHGNNSLRVPDSCDPGMDDRAQWLASPMNSHYTIHAQRA